MYSVSDETRKPIFEGVQGENESREIQFDISSWIEELGEGACTATAKRPTDTIPYPVTVTRSGNVVTWKPNSTDTAIEGIGAFQLEYSINGSIAKTRIWNTKIAPSLDPAGDPPDPYDNWLAEMRQIAADALQDAHDADASAQDAEAWAKGTKNGTPVPSTADQYQNNAKYFAEESYKNSEAWAVGQRGGVDVPSTDPAYENNSKYWAEQSLANQYGAFIVKSASGDIASFSDGADNVPMKSVNVTITPKQSGSGDPSPSNVRPITGTSTANIFVTGTNVWDEEYYSGGYILNDGTIATSGYGRVASKNKISVLPNTEYYFKASYPLAYGFRVAFYDANNALIAPVKDLYAPAFTTPSDARYMAFNTGSYYGTTYNHDLGINYPSTDHDYHPYAGHTTPVPLGQTVCGGEVDVTTGVLTIDKAMVDLATLTWSQMSGYIQTSGVASVIKAPATQTTRCDVIAEQYVASTWAGTAANGIGINGNGIMAISGVTSASGKMVYPLRNPTTVQLTPAQVASLLGTNNVWADCGAVAVEYRADPTLAYNELANVIVSLGGNI